MYSTEPNLKIGRKRHTTWINVQKALLMRNYWQYIKYLQTIQILNIKQEMDMHCKMFLMC